MEDTDILDTDENELQKLLEDELEEDSEFGSSTGEQNPRRVARRKKFHRHTQRQIHEMEAWAFFLSSSSLFFFFYL